MVDPGEIAALKASFRGAIATADRLAVLQERLDQLSASQEPDSALLDELHAAAAAHAVASAALRGLVESMQRRRQSP